jgi:DNA repair exonuclease SbcCD ATPase subunit
MADDLETRVASLEQDLSGVLAQLRQKSETISELEAEREECYRRIAELEQRVEKLEDDDGLIHDVFRDAARGDRTAQAAVCIRALVKRARRSDPQTASLDAQGIVDTLHSEIHRSNTYDVMDAADGLVDAGSVYKQPEPRTSSRNTRLVVDLEADDVPAQAAGYELTEGHA